MPQHFKFEPLPPIQGQPVTISYDFVGPPPAVDPVDVKILWGNGTNLTVTLSSANPETVQTVPDPCECVVVHDQSGQSADLGSHVQT